MKRLIIPAVTLMATACLAQVDPAKTMVIVNGEPIKAENYYQRMEILPNVGRLVSGQFVQATPGFMTLQQMMNEAFIVQLAKKESVYPSDLDLEAELTRRGKDEPAIAEAFNKLGLGQELYRRDTLVQLCQFRLQVKGVNITDFEIEAFYNNEKEGRYTIPERLTMRIIAVDSVEKRAAVDSDLKAGKSFEETAGAHSIDFSKVNGGLMGDVPRRALAPTIATHFVDIAKGETTDWITIGDKHIIYKVDAILPQEVIPLDAALKSQIRRQMMLDKGVVMNKLSEKLAAMRKAASIEYQGTPFDDQLKQAFGGE
jgi:foldase protein PrsA